ncbi:MAG: hypothetical protein ACE5FK_07270, partial [Candidatus Methylomirabilia bacterium]
YFSDSLQKGRNTMLEKWLPNEILKHALEDSLDLTLDPQDVPRLKRWIAREVFDLEREDAIHAVLEDRVKLKALLLEEKGCDTVKGGVRCRPMSAC